MINRKELVQFLDRLIEPDKLKDGTFNGLQFEGKDNVSHIGVAVDVSYEVLKKASDLGVDFLLTHHGLIWAGLKKIDSFDKKRIALLCEKDMNLYCSHLPLDLHPTHGNNVLLINHLGLEKSDEIFFDVGYYAKANCTYQELRKKIQEKVSPQLVEMNFGSEQIKKVAVCTGGAALDLRALFEAHNKGADTIISGETNSLYYHYAKELSMNILCAGHYATETFAVNSIMSEIKKVYGQICQYTFIDIPTGF